MISSKTFSAYLHTTEIHYASDHQVCAVTQRGRGAVATISVKTLRQGKIFYKKPRY